jgi:hypothetical protein
MSQHQVEELNTYQSVVSSMSTVGSGLILLTGIMFPALSKREIYFQLILFMSFSDFLFSLVGSFGAPMNMTMCTVQAGFTQFFTVSTWMFGFMLAVTIFCSFHFRRRYLDLWHMVAISWSIALLATCLPLTDKNITYSSEYLLDMKLSCYIYFDAKGIHDDESPLNSARFHRFQIWSMTLTGIFPLFVMAIMFSLCIFLYAVTLPRISEEDPEVAQRMRQLVNYIVLYPAAILLFFGPYSCVAIYYTAVNQQDFSSTVAVIFGILSSNVYTYGLAASLIFFFNASSARQMWRRWLVRRIGKPLCGMEEEDDLLKDLTPKELAELDDHDVGIVDDDDDDDLDRSLSLTFSDYRGSIIGSSRSKSSNSSIQSSVYTSPSVDNTQRGRTVSLGAKLRDTIPEADDRGENSGTINPIVSTDLNSVKEAEHYGL